MPSELMADEVGRQAAACLEYMRRGGNFTLWLDSKGFTAEDRIAIVRQIQARKDGTK